MYDTCNVHMKLRFSENHDKDSHFLFVERITYSRSQRAKKNYLNKYRKSILKLNSAVPATCFPGPVSPCHLLNRPETIQTPKVYIFGPN